MKFKLGRKYYPVVYWCEWANGAYMKQWPWSRGKIWIFCEGCRKMFKNDKEYDKTHTYITGIKKYE